MPPVVYVGPTLDAATVKHWLPAAQVMPPVARGDLYRDRELGFTVFLILDGIFFTGLAISPREILDVIQSGGTIVGASSMGAIRAADCWPAGMRGIGSIYRMYRRGYLDSEDEVAVAFSPSSPHRSATVSLVTVRFAVSRAVRRGQLTKVQGDRVVCAAAALHFEERTWKAILSAAGIAEHDGGVSAWLRAHDLKRSDAVRALKRVRQWMEQSPELSNEHRSPVRREPLAYRPRERRFDVGGEAESAGRAPQVWRWLVATGRYRRYVSAPVVQALHGASTLDPSTSWSSPASVREVPGFAARLGVRPADVACALEDRSIVVRRLARAPHDSPMARALWTEIVAAGDMDAVLVRFTAVTKAAQAARGQSLRPDGRQRYVALKEIAHLHGFRSWMELRAALSGDETLWSSIEYVAEEAALAKRVRYDLFNGAGAPTDSCRPTEEPSDRGS